MELKYACLGYPRIKFVADSWYLWISSTHDQLSCSVPIVTTITRSFHICSNQGIDDHCKKENHTRRQT